MCAIPESAEELGLQHCRFPTSLRGDVDDHVHDVVTLFEDDGTVANLGSSGLQEDLLLAAWAILLHAYLRSDIVTFVESSDEKAHPYEDPTHGTMSTTDTEVRVLQFQLAQECPLKDVRAATQWKSTQQALRAVHINTAVKFSPQFSLSNGMGNGYTVRPTTFHVVS